MNNNIVNKLIIIGKQLYESIGERALNHFQISVQLYDKSHEEQQPQDVSAVYVTNTFSGQPFEGLMKAKKTIISHIIVMQCIEDNKCLPQPKHPLYNDYLKDAIICVTKSKTDLINNYLKLIRFMNGQSRKDMKSGKSFERTHLIESRTDSDNYKCAVIYGIPIVFKEWLDELWSSRDVPNFDPSDRNLLLKFKVKPFYGLSLAFINFSNDNESEVQKRKEMEILAVENGGEVIDPTVNTFATHFVLNASKEEKINFDFSQYERIPDYVVYKSWFEESINIRNREDESHHHFFALKARSFSRTPSSSIKSSVRSLGILSPDYDTSFTFDSSAFSKSQLDCDLISSDSKIKSFSYNVCTELCQTETNYVNILKSIIKIFRDPLKNHEMDGQFPNDIEVKTIFGCLPPIIEVHEKILEKVERIVQNWSENNEIGKVFVEHSQQLLTAYPQYVNFHEKTKEMIDECIEKYPKFNLFLKVAETHPECGRQKLKELLINPIQRLPRYKLYLEALLNKTDEKKADFKSLKEALNTIVEVNVRINKGKDKTEGQMKMFDLLNDIEDCPATLLSAQRHFISNCDVKLMIQKESHESKEIIKFDNYLFSLLLFNDLLLICKKRSLKRTNSLSLKGSVNYPNSTGVKKNSKKSYKHIETIYLSSIKYIVNDESDEFENSFAIITCTDPTDRTFPTYPFMVKVPEFNKQKFLTEVSQTLLELTSIKENVISIQSFKSLNFSYANSIARAVSKSKYAIMRTKEKINRTFSVRRQSLNPAMSLESLNVPSSSLPPSSPSSTRRLSRALSNFLSPIGLPNRNSHRYLGSMTSMTSLNEHCDNDMDITFSLPTTPAPRKKKCQTNTPKSEQNIQIVNKM